MKILFLSQRFLMPMDTGGKIRTGNILKQLSKQHEITLISNVESPKDDHYLPEMTGFCSSFISVPWKEIRKYSPLFFLRLFFQMFSKYPVSVLNDYSSKLRMALEKELKNKTYDIAVCDFVQSALLFRNIKNIPTLLFQHNVESMIAQRHVDQNRNPIAKLFWWLQWKKMYSFEEQACHNFNTVIAVSDKDGSFFMEKYHANNTVTIPTGVDLDYYKPIDTEHKKTSQIVFCGSMDWLPNEDAVLFYIQDILPVIKKSFPDMVLTVVGRNPSPNLKKIVSNTEGIELTGWVDDTRPYIKNAGVFIVPIRIGGGTRMKIYEAMAMGKAIVSTTIGAEGLPLEHGTHIILADTPEDIGNAVIQLMKDEDKRNKLGLNARKFVEANFGWQSVADVFSGICKMTAEETKKKK